MDDVGPLVGFAISIVQMRVGVHVADSGGIRSHVMPIQIGNAANFSTHRTIPKLCQIPPRRAIGPFRDVIRCVLVHTNPSVGVIGSWRRQPLELSKLPKPAHLSKAVGADQGAFLALEGPRLCVRKCSIPSSLGVDIFIIHPVEMLGALVGLGYGEKELGGGQRDHHRFEKRRHASAACKRATKEETGEQK